jgi:hypothetical protein
MLATIHQSATAPRILSLHFFTDDLLKSYGRTNPGLRLSFINDVPFDAIIHSNQVGPLLADIFEILLSAAPDTTLRISAMGQGESIRLYVQETTINEYIPSGLAA